MEDVLCKEINLSIDCRNIDTPSAKRKTPLKKAPRSCALCQPNERASGDFSRLEICGNVSDD